MSAGPHFNPDGCEHGAPEVNYLFSRYCGAVVGSARIRRCLPIRISNDLTGSGSEIVTDDQTSWKKIAVMKTQFDIKNSIFITVPGNEGSGPEIKCEVGSRSVMICKVGFGTVGTVMNRHVESVSDIIVSDPQQCFFHKKFLNYYFVLHYIP